jgi:ATP-dependent Lon protease
MNDFQVKISAPAQKVLVTQYSRESGVRNLQRFVERIYRKVAVKMASKSEKKKSFIITEKNLPEFCGLAPHESDPVYQTMPVGVVTGLAWTQVGGTVLYVLT